MTVAARRLLITLLFVAIALNYVDRQVLALLKPTLEAEFGWSSREFAHLGSVFQIAAASALLFVGWFVDRVGVRLALGLGVALWSLAGMAHAFAASIQQFIVVRVALAAAESVGTNASMISARPRSVCVSIAIAPTHNAPMASSTVAVARTTVRRRGAITAPPRTRCRWG